MISLRSSSNNENMLYVTAITLTATLGGMLFGYDTSVIAGAIDALKTFFIVPLTLDEKAAAEVIAQVKAIGVISFLIILGLIISFIKKIYVAWGKLLLHRSLPLSVFMDWFTIFFSGTVHHSMKKLSMSYMGSMSQAQ